MHVADRSQLGWFVLQHHDPTVDPVQRLVPGATRILRYDSENRPVAEAPGALYGGALWERADGVSANSWWLTGAPVVSTPPTGATGTGGSWSLLRAVDTPDTRLERKNLSRPGWALGTLPKGWTGQASAATEEKSQIDLLHPDFLGLVAPQMHGPSSAGTYVYDIRDDGSPDPTRAAQLQQAWRVSDLGGAGLCGFTGMTIAHQLGVEDLAVRAGGFPMAEGRSVGLGSWLAGGPFTVGVGLCQHVKPGPDGHLSPLHLQTGALFLGAHDGPLDFRGQIDVGTADQDGYWQRVHLDWDPEASHWAGCQSGFGKWRWRVKLPQFIGDPGGGGGEDGPGVIISGGGGRRIEDGGDPGGTGVIVSEGDDTQPDPVDIVGGLLQEWADNRERDVVADPCGPVTGTRTQTSISDGGKPQYATSPYCQVAPGFIFKPQDPTLGATLAADDPCGFYHNSPNVAQVVAYGSQSSGDFVREFPNPTSHAVGQGGFAILPPDVDPFAVFRGESVTSSYTVQVTVPTGLAQLAFGDIGTGGLAETGVVMETGTGGRLDFKTVDSSGAVTATAYIPAGSSGDITSGGGGLSAGTPAPANGYLLEADASGDVVDSGIVADDVVTSSGAQTQDDVIAWDASGNAVSTGVQYDDIVAPVSPGAYAIIQRNSGDTAWAADTQLDARHDPNSTNWANPAHFLQNTDNQSTTDLVVCEFALPNHLAGGGGTGGTAISFTNYAGTNTGGLSGRRTSSTRGDLYIGGGDSGGMAEGMSFRSNSLGGYAGVEDRGVFGIADTLTADPTVTDYFSDDRPIIYCKSGNLWAINSGGDPFPLLPTAGEPVTIQADDDEHYAEEGYVTSELTLPTSGTGTATISNIIRAPSLVYDVSVTVKTAIPTTGGITSVNVGDGSDADRWGTLSSLAKNDQTTWEDWTVAADGPPLTNGSAGATDIVFTPVGGSWDAPAGVVVAGVRSGATFLPTYA